MAIRVIVLGATGSIGASALDLIRADREAYEVVGLSANDNADALTALAHEFAPPFLAMADTDAAETLAAGVPDATVLAGADGLAELAAKPADVVLAGIVGGAGLDAILAAIDAGNRVALANKEPMVMAGRLIMDRAKARGIQVLPVDSEHNAIYQCLQGHAPEDVAYVHLTASGGPFYTEPIERLRTVTPARAVKHPTWDMGAKISVDSATLMNKGLEVIEARWLFDLALDQIQVVIHPQSVVHSLVEFVDGNILAHMGVTDMRLPIQFALNWPKRVRSPFARLELAKLPPLEFSEPSFERFPCLGIALDAARRGGTATATMNAANEIAVEAFIAGQIGFMDIPEIVAQVLSDATVADTPSLDTIRDADGAARASARERIAQQKVSPTP